jgi:hypothetical protein
MSVPSSSLDIEILPAEEFSYVLVDPAVFRNIDGFSYGKVLVLELEEEGIENVKYERAFLCLRRGDTYKTPPQLCVE